MLPTSWYPCSWLGLSIESVIKSLGTNSTDTLDKRNTHRPMYWLSYTRQAPTSSWQDSCHRIHVSSMSAPNTIGAGMVPISRTLIHWIPSANDRWSSWTHLQKRHCQLNDNIKKKFCNKISNNFTLFFYFNRHCNPCGLWPAQLSLNILSRKVFTECRCQRHVKPPQPGGSVIRKFQLPPPGVPHVWNDWNTGFIPTQLMTNTSGCCYSL